MIALYPLLVSNSIPEHVIPGIAKVIENYLIVYRIDDIIKTANKGAGIQYKRKGKKLIQIESENPIVDSLAAEFITEQQSGIYSHTDSGNKDKKQQQPINVTIKNEPAKKEKLPKNKDISLQPFNNQQIALDPTWMKTDMFDKNGNKFSRIVGVKVVPYKVKSDENLANYLMYDKNLGKVKRMVIKLGRKVETYLYHTWKRIWNKITFGLGGRDTHTVTGDPRKDIILRRNILNPVNKGAESIFVLADLAELSDDFTTSAKGMMNLQRIGWGSIIIADNVYKRAFFCMTELKGMCSVLPYTMLYQTLSQAKVYEDIEDAKRTASSIFKTKRKAFSKIVGESVSQNKIINYGRENLLLSEQKILNEMYIIDENLGAYIKNFKPSNIKSIISGMITGKSNIPNVDETKLINAGVKLNSNFKKSYEFAKKVLNNTAPGVNKIIINLTAISIALTASAQKSKDIMIATKDVLKKFVKFIRKVKSKSKPNSKLPKEHYMELVLGITAVTAILSVISVMLSMITGIFILTYQSSVIFSSFVKKWVLIISDKFTFDGPAIQNSASEFNEETTNWFADFAETGKGIAPTAAWITLYIIIAWKLIQIIKDK